MTVSSVNHSQASQLYAESAPKHEPKPKPTQSEPAQDTVHISAAARKALATDADHDGDKR